MAVDGNMCVGMAADAQPTTKNAWHGVSTNLAVRSLLISL